MSNNTTGFWVIIALIAALSFVALVELAIAIVRSLARQLTNAVRSRRPAAMRAEVARSLNGDLPHPAPALHASPMPIGSYR